MMSRAIGMPASEWTSIHRPNKSFTWWVRTLSFWLDDRHYVIVSDAKRIEALGRITAKSR